MKTVGYTEEKPGVKSANRLIFVIGLFWLMILVTVGVLWLKWSPTDAIAVFSALGGVLYGGKLIQKPMERGTDNAPTS